jgi:hypothetical protein
MNPRTTAVVVFLGGVGVIAFSILDVHRSMAANTTPPSAQQVHALESMIEDSRAKSWTTR